MSTQKAKRKKKWQFTIFLGIAVVLLGLMIGIPSYSINLANHSEVIENTFSPPRAKAKDQTSTIPNHKGEKVPQEWIDKIHKAADGVDWKEVESNSLKSMLKDKGKQSKTPIMGEWLERGPSNIPGRIVDIDIDYDEEKIYALSDYGIVFKSNDLEASEWEALNDQFPLGLGVAAQIAYFGDGQIVVSGYIKVSNNWGIYYSQDDGQQWAASEGIGNLPIMGIRRMMKQEDMLFVMMQEYDPNGGTDYYKVYKSSNHGESFDILYESKIPVGDGGRHIKSDMWVSNDSNDSDLFLLLEDSLYTVNKNSGDRQFNGLVSSLPYNQALLTGLSKNGQIELTAYIADGDIGKFYAWNQVDQKWLYQGEIQDWWLSLPFGPNSFSCSQISPDTLYFGALLTSRSTDRGQTWETIDLDPTGSYALYHGDVPKTLNILNPKTGEEEVYMGTDGGIYRLDQEADHFNSLSIPGLNCTQIYKMVTQQSNPGNMYIGTQDNGYCHTQLGNEQLNTVDFIFQYGGDVTNVESGDGGESFWLWWLGDGCNYMSGPADNNIVSTWSPYWEDGQVPYWEAPICVSNHFSDRCYVAGTINNSTGSHNIKLQAVPGQDAVSEQLSTDFEAEFGGRISAIAISPIDSNYFYVTTENGYLCQSIDGGNTWSSTLISNTMYPRTIYPSVLNLGEVWIGGSGYSNSPVFHSVDNGLTLESLNTGLPSCLVEAFATNEDESILFAASSIGPFAYETSIESWSDMSLVNAPLVQYNDVEFLATENTVRFATYARGVWDFNMMTTNTKSIKANENSLVVYPNPASDWITIEVPKDLLSKEFRVLNDQGQQVLTGILEQEKQPLKINDLLPGSYFITLKNDPSMSSKFIKL